MPTPSDLTAVRSACDSVGPTSMVVVDVEIARGLLADADDLYRLRDLIRDFEKASKWSGNATRAAEIADRMFAAVKP